MKYFDGANHRQISSHSIQINLFLVDKTNNVYESVELIVFVTICFIFIIFIPFLFASIPCTIGWISDFSDKHIRFCVEHFQKILDIHWGKYLMYFASANCCCCVRAKETFNDMNQSSPQTIYDPIKFIRDYALFCFIFRIHCCLV